MLFVGSEVLPVVVLTGVARAIASDSDYDRAGIWQAEDRGIAIGSDKNSCKRKSAYVVIPTLR